MSYAKHLYKDEQEIRDLEIPEGVSEIKRYAFWYCEGLTSVTIGSDVASVGQYAFAYCTGLTAVHITDLAAWFNIEFGDYSANPLYCAKHLYKDGKEIKALEIPQTVSEIKNYAFYNCEGLTSVAIPDSVTSIGKYAFGGCIGLTTVNWNATNCTSAGSSSYSIFDGCTQLATVNIGENVESIPAYAFYGCRNLSSAVFQNPTGWKVSYYSSMSSARDVDVSIAETAAQYLGNTYSSYYWKRS